MIILDNWNFFEFDSIFFVNFESVKKHKNLRKKIR